MYSPRLTELFRSRAHAGTLDAATHYGEGGIPGQGPYVRLWLQVEDGVVVQARFKTFGCPASIACAEALCEYVEGQRLDQIEAVTAEMLTECVGGVPEGKEHCPPLAAAAWEQALAVA